MEERVLQSMAIDAWYDQMGDFIKPYTDEVFVKNRILFIKMNAPALKNELSFGKSKILKHVNDFISYSISHTHSNGFVHKNDLKFFLDDAESITSYPQLIDSINRFDDKTQIYHSRLNSKTAYRNGIV